MNLTDVVFWENYWKGIKLPVKVDFNFSFDRTLANALSKYLPDSGHVFEVGCAPGKWLSYASESAGLRVGGIEYSEAGTSATHKNLELLGINADAVISGDFFLVEPDKYYDVVMSFGFIEHFDDVDEVVKKHLAWLKPGGILILGIPNFSGFNGFIQSILDKEILDKHNLNIMNLDYFKRLAIKCNLHPLLVDYIGSFEPALAIPKYKFGNPIQFFTRCILFGIRFLRKFEFFDGLNSKYFSSYILAIYRKA
ncbi:bifunctional 2-polyprenyl-6-hydroxyphenol methylase/3-demethylubiquinol 3-O-methyltransferase UbiG [Polynucleobacter sp. AM-26B4]|uniref:class I SAM-dependent methyltransferase n=1 Tax=Polynucleobacter sp. AM-26B4 TaxID=2689103 RepID=UPI001C0DCB29|nr:class I SAM-dependent methyltransferase [Polynucleobacter sp. AM-26B4]MBU3585134.1 class I SAM-dependent methyltransferase [Polynucleobacter sp. AM-26B4]